MSSETHIMSERLSNARRIIVKIGSSLLVDRETGKVNTAWLESLAEDIARLHARHQDIAIVSSGAIAMGRRVLQLADGELKLEENQAAAAAGQIHLAHAYEEALRPHNVKIAQILLTLTDSEERRRYLNARSTLETLFQVGAIPIINENDTVATSEIRYGDNDRLAARVAQMVSADCLVLLSDVDGLYTANPQDDGNAKPVPVVKNITPEIESMAGAVTKRDAMRMGSGGMVTKLMAAKIAVNAGCAMVIANGHGRHPLNAIESGSQCTWFLPESTPLAARKQWIAGSLDPKGEVIVDDGAKNALQKGKSLLPAGIVAITGTFARGDAVLVKCPKGEEIARGLAAYSSEDAAKIKGFNSSHIENILGYRGRSAMIHADDMVLNGRR